MSAAIPVNFAGQRTVSESDVGTVPIPGHVVGQAPAPLFPNGSATPAGTQYDLSGRFLIGGIYATVIVSADGEKFGYVYPGALVVEAMLKQQNKTPKQKDDDAKAYINFIRQYDPNDPADVAEADAWVLRAKAVNYVIVGTTPIPGTNPPKYGTTKVSFNWVTRAQIAAEAVKIQTEARYNTSMHQF